MENNGRIEELEGVNTILAKKVTTSNRFLKLVVGAFIGVVSYALCITALVVLIIIKTIF